jgi:hypothetical protein
MMMDGMDHAQGIHKCASGTTVTPGEITGYSTGLTTEVPQVFLVRAAPPGCELHPLASVLSASAAPVPAVPVPPASSPKSAVVVR